MRPRDAHGDAHEDEPGPFPGSAGEAGTFATPADGTGPLAPPGHGPGRPEHRRRAGRDGGRGEGAELEAGHDFAAGPGRDRGRIADVIAAGVRGAEPAEIPGRLCTAAVELLPVAGASVSLRSNGVPVQLGSSGDRAARLSDLQATLGDGPCTAAAAAGAAVFATDLTCDPDLVRWPVFAQQATAAGIRAVYSMPLGNDTLCVGTLDLYREAPGELTGRELRVAELVARVMTVALMALPRGEENGPGGDAPWLSGLATAHDEVYQAVGMIMVQLGVGSDEALARLRAHAFAEGRSALEVAHDVVRHRKRFDPD